MRHAEPMRLPGVDAAWVRSQLMGSDAVVQTPFGERRIVYADHVASGRSLRWIETFITDQVLPFYANTHTEDSATGACMTSLVHDAARVIKACLGAEDCKLLFCGTGSTAAIKRLQEILGLVVPEGLREPFIAALDPGARPLVFVGPYEHHSNEVSWRETMVEVVEIPLDAKGAIDLGALRQALHEARAVHEARGACGSGRPIFGSFSAASNVTGAITDTRAVARLIHEHGGLVFFDFAAAAPHAAIDMRAGQPDGYDAIFVSVHKLVGGPGTPGLLVFDPALYHLRAPSTAGGGTVAFVSAHAHHFVADIEQREDAGTPGTLQRIRAALAFLVRQSVGVQDIERLEASMISRAIRRLRQHSRIELLGNLDAPRLAILSFLVHTADGRHLHPRLVARLLNDLFGIQSRGGCACAGPYALHLLDIGRTHADALRDAVLAGFEVLKPGWTRINFSYFIDEAEFEFLLLAIEFIAEHGERFMAAYTCDWRSGAWRHPGDTAQAGLLSMATREAPRCSPEPIAHRECMARAHTLLAGLANKAVPASCGAPGRSQAELPGGLPAALVSFSH